MNHMLVIDIGSSQITAAVAEITDARRIVVRGLGRARSGGLKQGVVIQIDSVVEALAAGPAADLRPGWLRGWTHSRWPTRWRLTYGGICSPVICTQQRRS